MAWHSRSEVFFELLEVSLGSGCCCYEAKCVKLVAESVEIRPFSPSFVGTFEESHSLMIAEEEAWWVLRDLKSSVWKHHFELK